MTLSARVCVLSVLFLLLVLPAAARAQSSCRFAFTPGVMRLLGDCVTSQSIDIPDGVRFEGDDHMILAVDPPGGTFRGAVVVARGISAAIVHTHVAADLVVDVCGEGDGRLRGIYFDGASGEISRNSVDGIHRGNSICEEGNGIEVRNRDYDNPMSTVLIRENVISTYQKTGIVVHGNVDATIEGNAVASSAAPRLLAPNGVQVGPVAVARIEKNTISGTFSGLTAAGSAILLMESGQGTIVDGNVVTGDADVGIHVVADGAMVVNNQLIDSGPDGAYDVGLVNRGEGNVFLNNTVMGFRVRDYGLDVDVPRRGGRGQQIE